MKKLVDIMRTLRGPRGCPWDRKQTFESLVSCLLEETNEVAEAVLHKDYAKLSEELGDLLCIIAMLIVIAETKKLFDERVVMQSAIRKMKHRHPHVFGKSTARSATKAAHLWHAAKSSEAAVRKRTSVLADLNPLFPALLRADKIQRRVARVGFDWPTMHGPLKKIGEELREMRKEVTQRKRNTKKIQEELGDLLFSVVNVGRKLHLSSEVALAKTNAKFIKRFQEVESALKRAGKTIGTVPLEELDSLWETFKKNKKK